MAKLMTAAEYRQLIGALEKRRHKYGARRTVVDGITFASAAEARRYSELKLLARAGEIFQLTLQPRFPLIAEGEHIADYIADFQYEMRNLVHGAIVVVEDVKGFSTPAYRLKKRLFLSNYPHFHFREVRKSKRYRSTRKPLPRWSKAA